MDINNISRIGVEQKVSSTTDVKKLDNSTAIASLKEGQVVEGEIKDIRRDYITIGLNGNKQINAKMVGDIELTIGQRMGFRVQENSVDRLLLKPVNINGTNIQQTSPIMKALLAANMPVNDKMLQLVEVLIKNQQPIDKQTIQNYLRDMVLNPEADIETIVVMNKNQIPLTPENIEQFGKYKNYEHRIVNEVNTLTEQLSNVLSDSKQPDFIENNIKILDFFTKDSGTTPNLKDSLSNLLSTDQMQGLNDVLKQINAPKELTDRINMQITDKPSEAVQNAIKQLDISTLSEDTKAQLQQLLSKTDSADIKEALLNTKVSQLPQELKDILGIKDIDSFEVLKHIKQIIDKNPQDATLKLLVSDKAYNKLFEGHIKNQFTLTPKEVADKNNVIKLYDKIEENVKELTTILKSVDNESKAMDILRGMKENIDFMKSLNENYTYVQIPIRLKNQDVHSDLYVFSDKESLKKKGQDLSALLHLDLASLGIIDIYINKQQNNIASNFYSEEDGVRKLISKNIGTLIANLAKKGYTINTQVLKREKPVDFVKDFINAGEEELAIKRFTFDVRA